MQLNRDVIFFHAIGILWLSFFLRLILISHTACKFIKKKYPKEWQEKFYLLHGMTTVFDTFSEIDDPILKKFEQAYVDTIRQLCIAALLSFALIMLYIYIFIGF